MVDKPSACPPYKTVGLADIHKVYNSPRNAFSNNRLYCAALKAIGLVPAEGSTSAICPTCSMRLSSMPISLRLWGMPT